MPTPRSVSQNSAISPVAISITSTWSVCPGPRSSAGPRVPAGVVRDGE
jgi:hypothetical protein